MSGTNLKPLTPFPALLFEENSKRILVVADLHLGLEVCLVEKGIHIPSQTSRIQNKIIHLIEKYKPDEVVFLGDIKQTISGISSEEWKRIPEFFESVNKYVDDVSVIVGNHDGNLEPLTPRFVKIFPSEGKVIGKDVRIGLFHGHAWPSPAVLECKIFVMGHIHPVLFFKDSLGLRTMQQVWVKANCKPHKLAKAYLKHRNINADKRPLEVLKKRFKINLGEQKLILLPAFNDLVGGVSINRFNRRLIGPILNSNSVIMNEAEIYLLDGTYVGTLRQVQSRL